MRRNVVLMPILLAVSYAYCNGVAGDVPGSAHEIVRKCKEVAKSMSDIVDEYSNATVTTNKGVVCVSVSNGTERCRYYYPQLAVRYPKMIVQRSLEGDGHDIHLDLKGGPTKYIEYRKNRINGLWLEFYTNGNIRVYMTLTNDCFSGSQIYFNEKGKIISVGTRSGSICDIPVVDPAYRGR